MRALPVWTPFFLFPSAFSGRYVALCLGTCRRTSQSAKHTKRLHGELREFAIRHMYCCVDACRSSNINDAPQEAPLGLCARAVGCLAVGREGGDPARTRIARSGEERVVTIGTHKSQDLGPSGQKTGKPRAPVATSTERKKASPSTCPVRACSRVIRRAETTRRAMHAFVERMDWPGDERTCNVNVRDALRHGRV